MLLPIGKLIITEERFPVCGHVDFPKYMLRYEIMKTKKMKKSLNVFIFCNIFSCNLFF